MPIVEPIYSDHRRVDERSLALHRLVADKLRANPALLDKARENLRRWQKTEGSPSLTLAEWENILSGPVAQVAQFLEERSERATRLRQSSPFAGILTETERQTIEADVYPRNHPERADQIDAAIGELSSFHVTHGYYAHGISPATAILPAGWEQRLIPISNPNTGGATGLCIDAHDLALSKYAAGRAGYRVQPR